MSTNDSTAPAEVPPQQFNLIGAELDAEGVLRDANGVEIDGPFDLGARSASEVPLLPGDHDDLTEGDPEGDGRGSAVPETVEEAVKAMPKIRKTKNKKPTSSTGAMNGTGDASLSSVAMDVDQPPTFTPTAVPQFSSDALLLDGGDIRITGHATKKEDGVEVITLFTDHVKRNDKVMIVKVKKNDDKRLALLDATRAVKDYVKKLGLTSLAKLPNGFRRANDEHIAAKDREIEQLRQLVRNAEAEAAKSDELLERTKQELKKRTAECADLRKDKAEARRRCRELERDLSRRTDAIEDVLRTNQLRELSSTTLDTRSRDIVASRLFGAGLMSRRDVYEYVLLHANEERRGSL
ncbi:hypothetical protein JCM10296v2_003868 [Rhodotorula toruloides]